MATKLGDVVNTGSVTFQSYSHRSYEGGITAHAGGGQANAYQLTKQHNRVETCATAYDSVILPNTDVDGTEVYVTNSSGKIVAVYPPSGDDVGALAANAPYYIHTASSHLYVYSGSGHWIQCHKGMRFVSMATTLVGNEATLTMDNADHDLNVSATIPITARVACFRASGNDSTAGTWFGITEKATGYVGGYVSMHVNAVTVYQQINVPIAQDGIIVYKFNAAWNDFDLYAIGYWVEG